MEPTSISMKANSSLSSLYVLSCAPCMSQNNRFPLQLIPGHEAIGTVVKMGKNVTGFAEGDRVVADVGITVSIFHQPPCGLTHPRNTSAGIASTAAAVKLYSARASMLAVSPWMEALRNILFST